MRSRRSACARIARSAVLSLMLGALATAFAQTGGVRGKVVDQNGESVEGADIVITFLGAVGGEVRSSSKSNGDFIQIGLRQGAYRLTFSKSGYETVTQEVQVSMIAPKDVGRVVMEKLPEGTLSQEEIQRTNDEVQRYFSQGVTAVENEDYSNALSSFEAAVEIAPDFAEAYFNMGYVYRKMNELERARESYERATRVRPGYYEAWVELGNLLNEDHQYDRSLEAFGKAVAIRGDEVSTLYNYGAVAMNAGAMPTAKEAFGKLLAIDTNNAEANYKMGMVLVNLGQNEQALHHLKKYIELEPEGAHAATAQSIIETLKKS